MVARSAINGEMSWGGGPAGLATAGQQNDEWSAARHGGTPGSKREGMEWAGGMMSDECGVPERGHGTIGAGLRVEA